MRLNGRPIEAGAHHKVWKPHDGNAAETYTWPSTEPAPRAHGVVTLFDAAVQDLADAVVPFPGQPGPRRIDIEPLHRPHMRTDDEVALLFESLADLWERETRVVASLTAAAMHPAYQRIIGLGMQAVPLLLSRLKATKRYWFWALAAITGENPATANGDVDDAVEAWLQWGRERGILVGE